MALILDLENQFKNIFDVLFVEKNLLIILYELYGITLKINILGQPIVYITVSPLDNCKKIKEEISKYIYTDITFISDQKTLCSLRPIETLNSVTIYGRMHLGAMIRGLSVHFEKPDNCVWCD